jgi:hypothetical protein
MNFIDSGIIKPDAYHPPFVIDFFLPFDASTHNFVYSYCKFASWDYILLYNILLTYDWSFMYSITSVDDAVTSLNAVVLNSMDQAIPRVFIRKSKILSLVLEGSTVLHLEKNYYYRCFKKKNSNYFYSKFFFYHKLVKATIKSDRLRLPKSIDNLNSQPKQFWKYVASYRKRYSTSIQLEVVGTHFAEPYKVADAFAKHFQSVFSTPSSGVFPSLSQSSEFLSLAPVSELDICKALRHLRLSKSVGLSDIPSLITKGCSEIFVPVLKHIFLI